MPQIVGILNVTEDSFSDGGRYLRPDAALAHAERLHAEGADWIELGPASSHPDAADVSPDEEIRRIAPLLDALAPRGLRLAVDSYQPDTQRFAAERGVGMLNDIRGFREPAKRSPWLRDSDCLLVVMHSVQGRATREERDAAAVWRHLIGFFDERIGALEACGVHRARLILDPGMGFFLASSPEPSLEVLRRLPELAARYGLPLLVSVSRKSFLGAVTGRGVEERGAATLAAELAAADRGAAFLRTHDVAALRDALAVSAAIDG